MVYDYKGEKIKLNDELVKEWERVSFDTICDRVIRLCIRAWYGTSDKKLSGEEITEKLTETMKTDIKVFGGIVPDEV